MNQAVTQVSGTTLADLKPGASATITAVDTSSPIAGRLAELGVFEGVAITVVRRAPAGDPIEIEVFGSRLSLRRNEARAVGVSPEP